MQPLSILDVIQKCCGPKTFVFSYVCDEDERALLPIVAVNETEAYVKARNDLAGVCGAWTLELEYVE